MDEPFGAVDVVARTALQRELIRIVRELQTTTLFVTHDVDEAFRFADRIVVMREGRVEQVGAAAGALRRPGDGLRARSRARAATTSTAATFCTRATCLRDDGPMSYLATHAARVAALTADHLGLVAVSLVGACVVAVAAGRVGGATAAASRRGCSERSAQSIRFRASRCLAVLVEWFGLGFTPIFVALVVYAQFMLARNVVAGHQRRGSRAGRRGAGPRDVAAASARCASSSPKRFPS